MGIPIARLAGRAALVGAMIAGGLLAAGIAQAQAQTLESQTPGSQPTAARVAATSVAATSDDDGQPTSADRQAELIAAVGGPAPVQHLIMSAPERPAVETRADDVQDAAPDPADALNAAEATRGGGEGAEATPPQPR